MSLGRPRPVGDGRRAAGACAHRVGRPWARAALAAVLSLSAALILAVSPRPLGAAPSPASEPGGTERDTTADRASWFPARTSFRPLLAAPREVTLGGAFLVADREDATGDFPGANLEADVALGHRLPVVRLQRARGNRPELTLGFEVGVFTRFFMETPQKDLISADFRVGAPFSARLGDWRARLTLLHVSAHLGDDFVDRFDTPGRQVTKDGFELLVARAMTDGLRLYGGGEWNFHVNPGVERAGLRAGVEWDRPEADAGSDGVRLWPFLAVDARATTLTEEVTVSGTGGMGVRVAGVVLRLEGRAHAGPTALGELRTRDETAAGVGLRVEP